MKREKIYEFAALRPLDDDIRQAIEDNIEKNAHRAPKDFEFGWNEDDDHRLHIIIDPVEIEVEFLSETVEVFATAPLWAKVAFTEKRRTELRDLVESVLADSNVVAARA
ncbi:hypothetical protein ACFQ4O_05560 [Methylopila musalis]|uniref:Uncharacterized protein n=1 Tax=Methylopila musalis TaxID=1134781 RepID=A0ABW3Z5K1_9HYPH